MMNNNELSDEMQRIEPNVEEAKEHLSNSFLDRLTKTNVYTYFATYTILLTYFACYALSRISGYSLVAALFAGLLIWTFIEYNIHRFPFHMKSSNPILKLIAFIFHGVHHAYPRDIPRSITPLIFSLPLGIIFYIIFKLIFGVYAEGVFTGFVLGYLVYTIIHDSTHHFAMNYPVLRHLKKNHMRHHYFDHNKNFGVSTTLWDHLFGTYVKNQPTKIERKK